MGHVMADESETEGDGEEEPKKKRSKLPLIIGLVLAILGGAGGFFAVQSGLILGSDNHAEVDEPQEEEAPTPFPDVAFLPVDPLVISLGRESQNRHLRFRAQLEVATSHQEEVQSVMPRVVDVLNGYLRAVELRDLETPSALFKLRAQMLRRVQVVTGVGRVKDLLVMEFVLN